jgi:hypothetical protein
MTTKDIILEAAEEESHVERMVPLRPGNAERVERIYNQHDALAGREPQKGPVSFSMGTTHYERNSAGQWFRIERKKNPAFWDKPQYFIIYPGPPPHAFIVVKQPRRIVTSAFRKAIMQIYKDATGVSWHHDRPGVDGIEQEVFDKRASGKKPELAYEIFLDGTWRRVK